jgi:cell division protein FtsB
MATTINVNRSDPRQSQRIKRTAALLLLVMGGSAVAVLMLGWRAAGLNRDVAKLARERATVAAEVEQLKSQATSVSREIQNLEDGNRKLEEQRVQLRAEVDVLNQTLSNLKESVPKQAYAAERNAQLRPRVYIQVVSDDNARVAEDLSKRLRQAGYLVPRTERVRAVPRQAQVRYFDRADAELANEVLKIVQSFRPDGTAVLLTGYDSTKMRERHIEVWF